MTIEQRRLNAIGADERTAERLLILEPGRAERNYWSDLWQYRELFGILAWRDVSVRYKQTMRDRGRPFAIAASVAFIQAWGSTSFSLQVAMSEAMRAHDRPRSS